jgi:hypothetical protein
MIQEVGVNVTVKCILWVKARPDYEPLFSILDGMRQDADKRFWIGRLEASEDNCDIEEGMGQMSTNVEIVLQMSQGACQFWGGRCEKIRLSTTPQEAASMESKEERRARMLAKAVEAIDKYLEWEEKNPQPDLTQIEEIALKLRKEFGQEVAQLATQPNRLTARNTVRGSTLCARLHCVASSRFCTFTKLIAWRAT